MAPPACCSLVEQLKGPTSCTTRSRDEEAGELREDTKKTMELWKPLKRRRGISVVEVHPRVGTLQTVLTCVVVVHRYREVLMIYHQHGGTKSDRQGTSSLLAALLMLAAHCVCCCCWNQV